MNKLYEKYIKRGLDILVALVALLVLGPLLGIVGIIVKVKLGSPILFKQARPGRNEKIFYLYKFRSMTNEKDEGGKLLPDSQRLTNFGKFLRASSIDELPELFNILKGDMSIVGPRPLSIYYLPHYDKIQRRRHNVRPGLTGLAQINGRNNLNWDDRFKKDIEYVENISLWLDIKIIFCTIKKVLKATDVSIRGTTQVRDFGPYKILKEEGRVNKINTTMTYPEIGSYFWLDKQEIVLKNRNSIFQWLPEMEDSMFTFSGRTAIDLAIRNILVERKIKKVYVPSYCCISMLQAFIDHDIDIEFYNVAYDKGIITFDINLETDSDLILIMNYFGVCDKQVSDYIIKLKEKKKIIIEDITHSLFSGNFCSIRSDYYVASLRKWFEIPTGGWIGKSKGKLSVKPYICGDDAVKLKIDGMQLKADYIKGNLSEKIDFLEKQSKFDNELIHVDRLLMIDSLSFQILENLDINEIKERRKKNARCLMDGLKRVKGIEILDVLRKDATPFVLPIILDVAERDSLRGYLMENGVYCPIHWPEMIGTYSNIREKELSIVCDQRYSERDMEKIIELIQVWRKNYDEK